MLFPSLMNEFFKPDWFGGMENANTMVPSVNIVDNEKEFELHFAVPGFSKEDFNLEVDKEILSVSGEVTTEDGTPTDNYTRREFQATSFKRTFTLPDTINADDINASYDKGILKVTLPKREESLPKPKRHIEIA